VLNEGFRLMLIGLSTGLAGSFVLTRLMSAILVGTKPTDPLTFGWKLRPLGQAIRM